MLSGIENAVFGRINDRYFRLIVSCGHGGWRSCDPGEASVVAQEELPLGRDRRFVSAGDLSKLLRHVELPKARRYAVAADSDFCAVVPWSVGLRLRRLGTLDTFWQCLRCHAQALVTQVLLKQRDSLLQELTRDGAGVKDWARAVAAYAFCDKYSFWVHNPKTRTFSCEAATDLGDPEFQDFITRDRHPNSLFEFLEDDQQSPSEFRVPLDGQTNSRFLGDMKTLLRLRLNLSPGIAPAGAGTLDGKIGILNLYSPYERFAVDASTQDVVRRFLETKYAERRVQVQVGILGIEQFFATYVAGQLKEFLPGLTEIVCRELGFEACSIFIFEVREKRLSLRVVCDRSHPKGKLYRSTRHFYYDVPEEASLDATNMSALPRVLATFLNSDTHWSYDLPNEADAADAFREDTSQSAKNEIVLPLRFRSIRFGVLRVTNKVREASEGADVANFTLSDLIALETVCSSLGNLLEIEHKYNSAQKTKDQALAQRQQLLDANESLQSSMKFLRHEVRSPVSTFNLTPEMIKRLLRQGPLTPEGRERIIRKLGDIKILGQRLAFVVSMFSVERLLDARVPEGMSVLGEIVLPVFNVTREYLQRQYGLTIAVDHDRLRDFRVVGDQRLLNIVLHALVDNAGKYTRDARGKAVSITGRLDKRTCMFRLSVSNDGLPIHEAERERIFCEDVRGEEARSARIDGDGMGLYISRRIMCTLNGDLVLESPGNPVTLTMVMPLQA